MLTVTGTIHDGNARPDKPLECEEGHPVLITILDEQTNIRIRKTNWQGLRQKLDQCKIETGIADLAHEHGHYLYGTPKKGDE